MGARVLSLVIEKEKLEEEEEKERSYWNRKRSHPRFLETVPSSGSSWEGLGKRRICLGEHEHEGKMLEEKEEEARCRKACSSWNTDGNCTARSRPSGLFSCNGRRTCVCVRWMPCECVQ